MSLPGELGEIYSKSEQIVVEVRNERYAQWKKWGEQNHDPITWLAILLEEVGEVAKAAVQANFENGDVKEYRKELIQVAAVAFQMIECYDRNSK